MSHDDFAFEPIRGLPAALPAGESLLWQGAPSFKSLAIHAYHVRKVGLYFLALVAWRCGVGINNGHEFSVILVSCAFLVTLGGIAMGVLSLLAYLCAHSTVYSITSRRVLLRHGVAVPMTMNIPFKLIHCAALKMYRDGTGDIALSVPSDQRVGYLITWPHLRPGHITRPCPSFRGLSDAANAAEILGEALAVEAGVDAVRRSADKSATVAFRPPTAAAA